MEKENKKEQEIQINRATGSDQEIPQAELEKIIQQIDVKNPSNAAHDAAREEKIRRGDYAGCELCNLYPLLCNSRYVAQATFGVFFNINQLNKTQ